MKRTSRLMKWLTIAVIALIIFSFLGKRMGWIGGKEERQVAVEKAQRRTITEVVSASGRIQPEVQIKISPDVSGEIVELNVKEGDRVKKGQLLLRILPDIYQSYVDRSVAALNTSKANLENSRSRSTQAESQLARSKAAYERNRQLFEEKLISASEWEQVKSAYEVAVAELSASQQAVDAANFGVRSSEASLREANDNLRKTSIFAPVDGTVSKLNVEKGERVVGTSQMAGTEMMVLADLDEMEVNVDVNENDIVRVHLGDTASIEVDAYLGKKFSGVVTEVANSANITGQSVDQVTNFTVKVRILRESYESLAKEKEGRGSVFHPGMSATVDIRTRKVVNVLSAPVQSVATRDTSAHDSKEGESSDDKSKEVECVFIVSDGVVELRPVTTGLQDNTYIEILSGIKENEEIISAPYSAISREIKKGDKVEVVDKDDLYSNERN